MPPARTHSPRCARHPRMAWIYGNCCVADRCADGYVAAKPRPGFRDMWMETRSRCHVDPRHAWMHFAVTTGTPRCGFGMVSTPARTRHASMPPVRTHAPRCARHPRMAWIYADCHVATLTAFLVPRRSTPCVDAFRDDNRHAAMRLRCGFSAGQNPARVNAASPDTCAALRAVSTHGVDLRGLLRRRSLCRWLCCRQTAHRVSRYADRNADGRVADRYPDCHVADQNADGRIAAQCADGDVTDQSANGHITDQHAVGGLADQYAGSPPVTSLQSRQGPIPPRGPAAAEGHRLPPP